MKTHTVITHSLLVVFISIITALFVVGCSDDEEKKLPAKTIFNPFDHTHDVPVTDVQKHKFEHDFAEQCVARELKNSVNIEEDKENKKMKKKKTKQKTLKMNPRLKK